MLSPYSTHHTTHTVYTHSNLSAVFMVFVRLFRTLSPQDTVKHLMLCIGNCSQINAALNTICISTIVWWHWVWTTGPNIKFTFKLNIGEFFSMVQQCAMHTCTAISSERYQQIERQINDVIYRTLSLALIMQHWMNHPYNFGSIAHLRDLTCDDAVCVVYFVGYLISIRTMHFQLENQKSLAESAIHITINNFICPSKV